MDKSKIRFVLPDHGWTYKFIKEAGFDVRVPYIGNNLFPRLFRELVFKFNLPGKSLWYNRENIVQNKTIFIFEALIIPDYIRWIHKNSNNCRIILFYSNPVKVSVNPSLIDDSLCEKWTVDISDSKKCGLKLYEGGAYLSQWKVIKEEPQFDIFYVGKDKGRLDKILELKTQFENLGLKTYFHIVAERGYQKEKDKNHQPFLPYETVLKVLGKTKAILHLSDGCQKGITIRIQESLIHEIKLITDDKDIVYFDFYNPSNIFVIGQDDMERLPEFLNSPYIHVESYFYESPLFENMLESIIGTSAGIDK